MQPKSFASKFGHLLKTLLLYNVFNNAKISVRLSLLVSFMAVLMVIGGGLGLLALNESEDELNHLFDQRLKPIQDLLSIQNNTLKIRMLLLQGIVLSEEPEGSKAVIDEVGKIIDDVNAVLETLNIDQNNPELNALFEDYKSSRYIYGAETVFPMISALKNEDADEAMMIESSNSETYNILETAIGNIVNHQLAAANADIKSAIINNNLFKMLAVIATAIGLILAAFFSFIIIRGVTAPLSRAVKLAHHVANGDLTYNIKVDSNDETGQLLRALGKMNVTLNNIVSDVYRDIESINESSIDVATCNNILTDRIEQDSISIELTSSHMNDVVVTNRNSADSAKEALDLAESACDDAMNGGIVIDKAVSAMNTISNSSNKISEVTDTIESIAFQTNLLAVNASIEAALAGEQGSGFSVVASEVKDLAKRAKIAAREIKILIDTSVDQVKTGKEFVDQSGQALSNIQKNIINVADIVKKINTESEKQTAGIDVINKSIEAIHLSSKQNVSTIEVSAKASDSMFKKVTALMSLMRYFKLNDNNGKDK